MIQKYQIFSITAIATASTLDALLKLRSFKTSSQDKNLAVHLLQHSPIFPWAISPNTTQNLIFARYSLNTMFLFEKCKRLQFIDTLSENILHCVRNSSSPDVLVCHGKIIKFSSNPARRYHRTFLS